MTTPPASSTPTTPPPRPGPTRADHLSLGDLGERFARQQLVARGLVPLDRNWRCDEGELDLVMLDGSVVVAVEVKTRRTVDHGHPVAAVDDDKLARLHRLVWRWLEAHGVRARGVRVDVAGVLWPRHGRPTLTYVQGLS